MSDKIFLEDASNVLNREKGNNNLTILDKVQGFANRIQESLKVPIISNSSEFYNYEDKENKDILINKRKEYVIKALERVLLDDEKMKKINEIILTHKTKWQLSPNSFLLKRIREEINPILSRAHKLDKNTSPETIKWLEKEYNIFSVEDIILGYLNWNEKGAEQLINT